MNSSLKSSVYVDLFKGIFADVADDLACDLSRECEKVVRIFLSNGFNAAQRWIESKLDSFVSEQVIPEQKEFSDLFRVFFTASNNDSDLGLAARAYAHARQILHLFRKLEDVQCLQSEAEALASFWDRQATMEGGLTTAQVYLARQLAEILPTLIPDLPDDPKLWPAPDIGPGVSYEKRPRNRRPAYYCDSRFSFWEAQLETPSRESRASAVPKTWKKRRLIFVEPSSRMLIQKALQSYMYAAAARYPLRSYVNFGDQTFQHSKLREPDASSIDLSDASDYIDRRIVWLAFQRLPKLRSVMFSSRSVASASQRFRCYSTMGNATTFPVMTLLLTASLMLCESEVNLRLRRAHLPPVFKGGVFGDDVVCHSSVYGGMVCVLSDLGLKINVAKSYVASSFKESCGLDLFLGRNVTPVKVRSLTTVKGSDYARLVAYTNSLFITGYWRASDVLLSEVLSRWPSTTFGPFGAPDCVWSYTLSDYVYGQYARRYQRVLPWKPHAKIEDQEVSDDASNLQFWLAHGHRPSDTVEFSLTV